MAMQYIKNSLNKGEQTSEPFELNKTVRLGTAKAPAQLSVQSEERKQELAKICTENKWACNIQVQPDQDEDIRELETLQNKPASVVVEKKPNRNEPCSCGSEKKYKKCCGA